MQYNQHNDKKDEKKTDHNVTQNKPTGAPAAHDVSHDTKAVESDKSMMDKKVGAPDTK